MSKKVLTLFEKFDILIVLSRKEIVFLKKLLTLLFIFDILVVLFDESEK